MKIKELYWMGQTAKDLNKLPKGIIESFVYGLRLAQQGGLSPRSKPLKGFGGVSVIELIESDRAGTYRAVYAVKMKNFIYVLHIFQKKSKQGIATPKKDIDLIKSRLKQAQEIDR
ncbi:MAG TPA: type II toxin-antitoxin system RelE/ParE family toxin [Candidatus Babeliales bacterium]|nr:type II toxin-antitoxin system RelE/ParE family toxin [Candidatus Babeliales bacterium]